MQRLVRLHRRFLSLFQRQNRPDALQTHSILGRQRLDAPCFWILLMHDVHLRLGAITQPRVRAVRPPIRGLTRIREVVQPAPALRRRRHVRLLANPSRRVRHPSFRRRRVLLRRRRFLRRVVLPVRRRVPAARQSRRRGCARVRARKTTRVTRASPRRRHETTRGATKHQKTRSIGASAVSSLARAASLERCPRSNRVRASRCKVEKQNRNSFRRRRRDDPGSIATSVARIHLSNRSQS
jgi:hypothetical protein